MTPNYERALHDRLLKNVKEFQIYICMCRLRVKKAKFIMFYTFEGSYVLHIKNKGCDLLIAAVIFPILECLSLE